MNSDFREHLRKSPPFSERREAERVRMTRKHIASMFQESKRDSGEHSQKPWWQSTEMRTDRPQNANDSCRKCKFGEKSQNSLNQQWYELSEVIESDFLISSGDFYSNRKVELEDADIKDYQGVF